MAETEAIFKLRVDTGNSVNDVENLTSAVNDTQKATEGKGVTDFEKKLNQLDKTLKDGNLTMRQRSQLVRQYQQIALQAGETSPIGDRAVRSAAALTDQIGDLNQRVRLLSSDTVKLDTALQGISVGASAFQGVQSAIALTGVENEELIKSMQKLQAVQGVVNSVQAIANALNKDAILGIQLRVALEKAKNFILGQSVVATTAMATAEGVATTATVGLTAAQKALRIALLATGIGAVIALLALAADAMGVFGEETDETARMQKALERQTKELDKALERSKSVTDSLTESIQSQTRAEIARLKSIGATEEALTKAQRDAIVRRIDALQFQFNEESKIYLRMTKNRNASVEDIDKAEKAFLETTKNLQDARLQLVEFDAEISNKRIQDARKQREELAKFYKEIDELMLKSAEEMDKKERENAKLLNDYISGLLDESEQDALKRFEKEIAEEERREQKRLDLIRAYNEVVMTEYELEALDFQENQQKKSHDLAAALYNNLITQQQYDEALKALAKEQAEFEVDLEKRKQEAIKAERDKAFQEQVQQIEKVIGITQQFVGVTNALNGLLNASDQERLKQVKGNAVEEEKVKRRMFERDKKQRIAQTAIDTAANVVRSVANGGGIPAGIPFGIAAGTMGALQIAAISKQTFDGTSGGGSFNAPPPSTQAPVTTANETNPNNTANNLPKMTKVVVVENDITRMQKKVQVTESLSGF